MKEKTLKHLVNWENREPILYLSEEFYGFPVAIISSFISYVRRSLPQYKQFKRQSKLIYFWNSTINSFSV